MQGTTPLPLSSKLGTYKTVKTRYKTVKVICMTVKATCKTVKARLLPWLEPFQDVVEGSRMAALKEAETALLVCKAPTLYPEPETS